MILSFDQEILNRSKTPERKRVQVRVVALPLVGRIENPFFLGKVEGWSVAENISLKWHIEFYRVDFVFPLC